MDLSRQELPGGELIAPYLAEIGQKIADACLSLSDALIPAWLTAGTGNCGLATNRDFFDLEREGFVCGFNPLPVGRLDADDDPGCQRRWKTHQRYFQLCVPSHYPRLG